MQIFIKTLNGKSYLLDVNPEDTIKEVKKKIEDKEGIAIDLQRLIFAEKKLKDNRRVNSYNIAEMETIHLFIKDREVRIVIPYNATIKFYIMKNDTVREVKKKIKNQVEYSIEEQKLSLNGRELNDNEDFSKKASEVVLQFERKTRYGLVVYIRSFRGKKIAIETHSDSTVLELKERIEEKEGIPIRFQELVLWSSKLENHKTLSDYQIRSDYILCLIFAKQKLMHIFYTKPSGRCITLYLQLCDTIEDIRYEVCEREGYPIDRLMLIYAGKRLEDKKTLADYNIGQESTVHILFKFRAGKKLVIQVEDESYINIDVEDTDTIYEIKGKIEDMIGFPLEKQRLYLNNKQLDNTDTVVDINEDSKLVMNPYLYRVELFIKGLEEKDFVIYRDLRYTVSQLKRDIEDKIGVPSEEQRIVFAGKALEDTRLLIDCTFPKESALHLIDKESNEIRISIKTMKGKIIELYAERMKREKVFL